MPTDQDSPRDVLLEFLQREAPIELERLRSIAQVVAPGPSRPAGRPEGGDHSHQDWMQVTFAIFGAPGDVDFAA